MTKTEYVIEILRTGDGATQATREFQQVGAAATVAKTQVAGFGATVGNETISAATKTKQAQQAISGSLRILAFTAFPEVAGAAMLTQASFGAVRGSALLLGASIASMTAVFAALAGAITIVWQLLKMFSSQTLESATATDLAQKNQGLYETLLRVIDARKEEGTLTAVQHALLRGSITATALLRDNVVEESKALHLLAEALTDVNQEENKRIKLSGEAHRLFNELALAEVGGAERDRRHANQTLGERLALIEKLRNEGGLEQEEADRASGRAVAAYKLESDGIDALIAKQKEQAFWASETGRIIQQGAQAFSTGFSNAFLDFVSGVKSADEAFKQFGSNFLRLIADMILQTIILKAIQAGVNAIGGTNWGNIVNTVGYASGGVRFAANGIATVSQPTYFPRFNVVAGEAGPEMLTVLSRPRLMELGGVQAAVGRAGAAGDLAITRAQDLARSGGGGAAEIVIRLSSGLEASITSNSIEGARIRVVQDMGDDSQLSQATKRLLA